MKRTVLVTTSLLLLTCLNLSAAMPKPVGVWEVGDGAGLQYSIRLMPDRIAYSTYPKSDNGALGEQGVWRMNGDAIMVVYDSGWIDMISEINGKLTKQSYKDGTKVSDKPDNTTPAKKLSDDPAGVQVPAEDFVGLWQLKDETDTDFFLHVMEDYSARSNYAGGRFGVFGEGGIWRQHGDRITITYNSGWVNVIVKTDDGYAKFGYSPDQNIIGKPDNKSMAKRLPLSAAGIKDNIPD